MAALLALVGSAHAQQVKPRILLIFDTSGSMGFDIETDLNTGGDNSVEYPGDGGLSRLYVAKNVIRSIVETTSEVEFALMRYPQTEGLGINNGAGRAAFTGYDGLGERPLNYAGYCNGFVAQDPDFPDRSFSLLVDFEVDNENDILAWMNHRESYPQDRELRAEGPTPLAESLRLARDLFRGTLRTDPALRCRRNYVVLLTDGAESCAPDPEVAVIERAGALRGVPVRTDDGDIEKDVRTYVIGFSVEAAVAARLDEVARAGGTAIGRDGELDLMNGQAFRADDEAALRQAFSRILAEAIPGEECNGEDDDCDGRIDEGALNACGACGPVPDEVCDELDNDCDGIVDETVRNACGRCGPVPEEVCNTIDDDCDGSIDEGVANPEGNCNPPADEVCNGLDDDFDGRVDNRPGTDEPLSRACSQDIGACRVGNEYCRDGRWGDCDGVLPTDEACNGEDDDCDGITDEITRACGEALNIGNVGACRVGAQECAFLDCLDDPQACEDGGWSVECIDSVGPTEEQCDSLDNDCDGNADEGLFNACGVCGVDPPEVCNGLDDNCDGRIDENAECPRGYLCYFGECVVPCANGECSEDTFCVRAWPGHEYCHPDPCAGAVCPIGFVCDPEQRQCTDPCRNVECPEGQGCDLGECVPAACRHTGCPDGQRCEGDGCAPDPCAGAQCEGDTFCRDGDCVSACVGVQCEPGDRCVDGECSPDPCGGRCLRGELCDPIDGACVADPCRDVACPPSTACVEGECRADTPCANIECPVGTVCFEGSCTDFLPAVEPTLGRTPPDAEVDPGFDQGTAPDARVPIQFDGGADGGTPGAEGDDTGGTGGCDCTVDEGPSPLSWLGLLIAGAWGFGRRRR